MKRRLAPLNALLPRGGRLAILALLLAACVPYPGAPPRIEGRSDSITTGPFEPLDPGASELDSLHFSVRAYGPDAARQIAQTAEESYGRIMVDTNLYSFRPKGLYRVMVYATSDEYRKKTDQPAWSGGVSVGNAICTFHGPHLPGVLAHEMTHLIFYEYMGRSDQSLRWINEGLAVYQETIALATPRGARDPFVALRESLAKSPIPMEHMESFVPATEHEFQVNNWYAQAYGMVRFMIERGGRMGFSQFLAALKERRTLDDAFAAGFPAWRTAAVFYAEWRRSL
ncbi:MAG: hypothetical protein HY927_09030 [Elusimicrobia bacterium]|nr:hypothetical protein [Elusimicrobiota bacterium]